MDERKFVRDREELVRNFVIIFLFFMFFIGFFFFFQAEDGIRDISV